MPRRSPIRLVIISISGQHFHAYINPERDVPAESTAITGLTYDFLKDHSIFSLIVDELLSFIQNDRLVIHNAPFDLGFLNAELGRLNKPKLEGHRVTDTLVMARQKFPGSPASLDALCKRFQVDLSGRKKHGALLDSQLLAQVYLELLGGRQRQLSIQKSSLTSDGCQEEVAVIPVNFPRRTFTPTLTEVDQHKKLVKKISNNLWGY